MVPRSIITRNILEIQILGPHTRPTESKPPKVGTAISILEIFLAYSYTNQHLKTTLLEYHVLHDVFQYRIHIGITLKAGKILVILATSQEIMIYTNCSEIECHLHIHVYYIHTCMFICMYIYVHVCIHLCIYIYVCIYTYIHIQCE